MQPLRIGVNAALVLLLLLLSVPLQLLLSNLVAMSITEEDSKRDLTDARTEALDQLLNTAESVFTSIHSTIMYYSTWAHLKELVVVPYQRRSSIKSTVFKSKAGTTTILISSMEDGKAKKTSSQSKGSVRSETDRSSNTGSSKTGNSERQAKLTSQFHRPDETKTSSSRTTTTTTNQKKVIFEEVSYAREVEEYLMNEVYFTQSKVPRDTKSSSIKYSVGQLVRHKTAEYVGVIIGWDNVAKAPEKWIKRYYSDRKGVELTAHYLILVDSKYSASGSPYHYVPQEDIELGPQQQLRCPEVSEYFEGFENGRYIPKPWLEKRYPQD